MMHSSRSSLSGVCMPGTIKIPAVSLPASSRPVTKALPRGTVLVTGASSGIGWETVLMLARQGATVFAASRTIGQKLAQAQLEPAMLCMIHAIELDILDEISCAAAVNTVLDHKGHLDALVHCAGTGLAGSIEEIPLADAVWQYDNLLFGTIRMLRAVLPRMRHQGHGRIILVTSVAATIPVPFQTYYSSAKAAVQALALGLSDEVRPFGIKVTIVAPGDTRTGFTEARRLAGSIDHSPYGERLSRSVSRMARDEQNGMASQSIALAIVHELSRKHPKLMVTPGLHNHAMTVAGRILPLPLVRWIVRLLYG
ncbi:MAG: SDR family NAD(P)-dependent oxidoreductase [Clostridia bacterium]|nr:SDR family NAD(P)-dependent oxidoreductase [Clostridia bacterium]